MKLLTKKDTDSIFILYNSYALMDSASFNKAVNHILYDKRLTNLILKRVKRILAKIN